MLPMILRLFFDQMAISKFLLDVFTEKMTYGGGQG